MQSAISAFFSLIGRPQRQQNKIKTLPSLLPHSPLLLTRYNTNIQKKKKNSSKIFVLVFMNSFSLAMRKTVRGKSDGVYLLVPSLLPGCSYSQHWDSEHCPFHQSSNSGLTRLYCLWVNTAIFNISKLPYEARLALSFHIETTGTINLLHIILQSQAIQILSFLLFLRMEENVA